MVYDASKNSDEKIIQGLASLKVKAEVKKSSNTESAAKK